MICAFARENVPDHPFSWDYVLDSEAMVSKLPTQDKTWDAQERSMAKKYLKCRLMLNLLSHII